MNTQRKILASVGIMLLAATASFAQQVKTDYDRSTDFGQYKTYSWEKVQTQDPYGPTGLRKPSMGPWQPKAAAFLLVLIP